ncbi:MAG: glycosyl hydrolase-related protein, partial [Lentisphaeria bacterium]
PDYNADQGIQIFTYSLLPHEHALQKSNVLQEAAILNRAPLFAVGANTADQSPFRVEGPGLNLEVMKRAEKEDSLILRIIETDGTFSTGILHTTLKGIQIAETDLLEWHDQKAISMDAEHPLSLSFKPFEIRTYKIRME